MFFLQKHLVFDNLEVAPVHKCHKFEKRAKDINNRCTKSHAKSAKTPSFLGCKEFKSIKSHAKNAKTQSFLGCKEFKSIKSHAKNAKTQSFF